MLNKNIKLDELVEIFNECKGTYFRDYDLVSEIAKMSINEIYLGTDVEDELNDNLYKELVDYLVKELMKVDTVSIKYDEYKCFVGIVDDFTGNFLVNKFKYGTFSDGPNEFLRADMPGSRSVIYYEKVGIRVGRSVSFDNKMYIVSDKLDNSCSYFMGAKFNYVLYKFDGVENPYNDVVFDDNYFICREYDKDGIRAINFVYPDMSNNVTVINNGDCFEKRFVGSIVKYTKGKKQDLNCFNRPYYNDGNIDDIRCFSDELSLIFSNKLSNEEWNALVDSTRISNYSKDKNYSKIKNK